MTYFSKSGRTAMAMGDDTMASWLASNSADIASGANAGTISGGMTAGITSTPATPAAPSSPGVFSSILTTLTGGLIGGANAQGQAAAYNAAIQANAGTPSWLPIVAIGGIALVGALMLTGPKSNPARRRRHRRARRTRRSRR